MSNYKNDEIDRFIIESLRLYVPISAGPFKQASDYTIRGAQEFVSQVIELAKTFGNSECPTVKSEEICKVSNLDKALRLKELLQFYGSDKASDNGYFYIYGQIFSSPEKIKNTLEIGLGSNNLDVLSNMGVNGKPGASLRAFRDFLPNALIWGADIDSRILFEEERIKTFQVDQTDADSLARLSAFVPDNLDLVIDDGLHSPLANINTLNWALSKVRIGGWVIIEDIANYSIDVWRFIGMIMPRNRFVSNIVSVRSGHYNFAVLRVS